MTKFNVQLMKTSDWDPLSEMAHWALITMSPILYLNQIPVISFIIFTLPDKWLFKEVN